MKGHNTVKLLSFIAIGLFITVNTATADGEWATSGSNIFNTNSANVGIGTNDPQQKLHLSNGSFLIDNGSLLLNQGHFYLQGLATGASRMYLVSGNDFNNATYFNRYNAECTSGPANSFIVEHKVNGNWVGAFEINNLGDFNINGNMLSVKKDSGNVGIGTSEPTAKLHVMGGGIKVAGASEFSNTVALFGMAPYLYIGSSSGAGQFGGLWWDDSKKLIRLAQQSSVEAGLAMDSAGNIGIGTTNPKKLLTLNKERSGLNIGDGTILRLQSAAAQYALSEIGFNYNGASGENDPVVIGYRNMTGFSGYTKGDFYIATRDVETDTPPLERLTVKTNGSVGIGTAAPGAKLQVEGNVAIGTGGTVLPTTHVNHRFLFLGINAIGSINSAGSEIQISSNSYIDTPGSRRYITTRPATLYEQTGGDHVWYYKASGTAGDLVNFTEAMRIDNVGRVGIGTTNPQSTLAVNGTITTKKVKVTEVGWSDFVFDESYKLPTLAAVESHIKQYKHLPGIPSAKEIQKKGLDVSDVLAKQMQKIEELTLYMIEMQKENQNLKNRLNALEKQVVQN